MIFVTQPLHEQVRWQVYPRNVSNSSEPGLAQLRNEAFSTDECYQYLLYCQVFCLRMGTQVSRPANILSSKFIIYCCREWCSHVLINFIFLVVVASKLFYVVVQSQELLVEPQQVTISKPRELVAQNNCRLVRHRMVT